MLLIIATVVLWKRQGLLLEEEKRSQFEYSAAVITMELRERLNLHAQFLRTVSAYFATRQPLQRVEWDRFSEQIDLKRNLPGMHAFGFSPAPGRKGLEESGRPLQSVEPPGTVTQALDSVRYEAINQARDLRDLVISAPIDTFTPDGKAHRGFLMLYPIYQPGMPTSNVGERRTAFAGVVYATYRIDDFMETLGWTMTDQIGLRIVDAGGFGTLPDEGHSALYASDAGSEGQPLPREDSQHEVSFGGRHWLLLFNELAGSAQSPFIQPPTQTLVGGIMVSTLLALLFLVLANHRQRAVAYAQNITAELRQAEERSRAADMLKQAVLDAATEIAVIAIDREGVITLFNRGAEKMLGYRASDLIGLHTPEILHVQDEISAHGKALSAEFGRSIEGLEVLIVNARARGFERREWTFVRADGRRILVDLVVTTQVAPDKTLSGYLGIAVDITERKRAEQELKKQHTLLETLIQHMPCGVSLTDANYNVFATNRRFRELLDLPDELFEESSTSIEKIIRFNALRGDYGPGNPEDRIAVMLEKIRNPSDKYSEFTRPNGSIIEINRSPLPEGGFVTVYNDITKRRQEEAELTRHRDHLQELVAERTADLEIALQQARSANQAKSEFLTNMSHELRTPMHAILSFSGLGLQRSRDPAHEKLHKYFDGIRQSAERLLDLVNDLLDLSKLEAGRMETRLAAIDILRLVEQVIGQMEAIFLDRNITATITSDTKSTLAYCDEHQIQRVVLNLLANAAKFSPPGGTVSIRLSSGELVHSENTPPVPALRITVSDDGIGIPASELESIFEKFVQGSKTKTGAGGTGLGLAISREIIRIHGGNISAANNPSGLGASFQIDLPSLAAIPPGPDTVFTKDDVIHP